MAEATQQEEWHDFAHLVLIDQREKLPYTFEGLRADKRDGGGPLRVRTQTCYLVTGDYTIAGHEAGVAVEKKTLQDLYGTIGQGRDRFERELQRLNTLEFAAVVIEATWPEVCAEPPPHTRLPPKTVFRSILAWSVRYPRVHWFPCGERRLAEVTTFRLLERYVREKLAAGAHTEG